MERSYLETKRFRRIKNIEKDLKKKYDDFGKERGCQEEAL